MNFKFIFFSYEILYLTNFAKKIFFFTIHVFSLKFKEDDENLVISGGWDNTVQIWDLRTECSIRSFYGPHICGDAVDLSGNTVLTGSLYGDRINKCKCGILTLQNLSTKFHSKDQVY
eukprot:GSMAST32.ASY1.ANO1.1328.1 assembled CDS